MVKRYSHSPTGSVELDDGEFVPFSDYETLAAELAETQRQLKMVAPVGRYNGRNIEEWATYGAALEAALRGVIEPCRKGKGFDGHIWHSDCPRCMAVAVARKLLTSTAETKADCTCKPVTTNLPHLPPMQVLDEKCPIHGFTLKIKGNES